MRVISGKARGKKLISPETKKTRPTLDRVKEAMFNKIQFLVKDATCLDLFSGTGALGIEALSRGARKVFFCDNDKNAIRIIKKNIEVTKNLENATILNKDYNLALDELIFKNIIFDIIFLDPPYKTNLAALAMQKIIMSNMLTEDGIIIIETDDIKKKEDFLKIDNLQIFDERKYGSVWLIFIRKE